MAVRAASHAGSWYTNDGRALGSQLAGWLEAAGESCGTARAVIAPHAGFSYSGPTAAWAYKHVKREGITRVFLLGPSHSMYTPKCQLTGCSSYATPLGPIPVDGAVRAELAATGLYEEMTLDVDETEHSLELHLPYIHHVMGSQPYTLVPILVGALSEESERRYGAALAPYLADPQNLFVISSDFCHWGKRFRFTRYDKRLGEIYESVAALDRLGMELIERQDAAGYAAYQRETANTICGQHAIAVLLNALEACNRGAAQHHLQFVRYDQSSAARSMNDSSVSYASAVVWSVDGPPPPSRLTAEKLCIPCAR